MNAETFDFVVILSALCLLLSVVAGIGALIEKINKKDEF